jgi:hypothetical protein
LTSSYVRVPPDDSGKKLRTLEEVVDGQTVEVYVVVLEDGLGNVISPVPAATTPAIYNVDMDDADTEYEQALPSGTKKFMVFTADRSAFRIAFETGKVATPTAPYLPIDAKEVYYEDGVNLTGVTVYFASSSTGKVAVVVAWT